MQFKYRKYTLQVSTINFIIFFYVKLLKEEHILIVLIA